MSLNVFEYCFSEIFLFNEIHTQLYTSHFCDSINWIYSCRAKLNNFSFDAALISSRWPLPLMGCSCTRYKMYLEIIATRTSQRTRQVESSARKSSRSAKRISERIDGLPKHNSTTSCWLQRWQYGGKRNGLSTEDRDTQANRSINFTLKA